MVAVATALVAACAGGGGKKVDVAASGATTTAVVPDPGGTDQTAPPTTKVKVRQVRFPAGGIVDQVVPPGDDAYGILARRQCAELEKTANGWRNQGVDPVNINLYHGAAAACLFKFDVARADLARLPADLAANPDVCTDKTRARRIVFEFLKTMVALHDADPSLTFQFVNSPPPAPCPKATTTSILVTTTTKPGPTTTKT